MLFKMRKYFIVLEIFVWFNGDSWLIIIWIVIVFIYWRFTQSKAPFWGVHVYSLILRIASISLMHYDTETQLMGIAQVLAKRLGGRFADTSTDHKCSILDSVLGCLLQDASVELYPFLSLLSSFLCWTIYISTTPLKGTSYSSSEYTAVH